MRTRMLVVAVLALLAGPSLGKAQVAPPFFFPGAVAYDPVIGVVGTGAVLDAQAVVSPDRKYVTLNMRPQNTQLLSMQTFAFSSGTVVLPTGFVGFSNPAVPSLLTRPGMSRVGGP